MRCKICQTDGHLMIYSGKGCCNKCFTKIFDSGDGNFGWTHEGGILTNLWTTVESDIGLIGVYFEYGSTKTVLTHRDKAGEPIIVRFNEVKPMTPEFLLKVKKNIKTWQVFS